MSVINQMLKDLDKRQASQETLNPQPNPIGHSAAFVEPGRQTAIFNRSVKIGLFILLPLLLLIAGYGIGSMQPAVAPLPSQQKAKPIAPSHNTPLPQRVHQPAQPQSAKPETTVSEYKATATQIKPEKQVPTLAEPKSVASTSLHPPQLQPADNTTPLPPAAPQKIKLQPRSVAKITAAPTTPHSATQPTLSTSSESRRNQKPTQAHQPAPATKPVVLGNISANDPLYAAIGAQRSEKNTEDTTQQLSIKHVALTPTELIDLELKKADLAKTKGDLAQTRQHLKTVLQLDPQRNKTRTELAALLFGSGETNSAIATLEQGLVISPDYAQFRLILARIFLKQNNPTQAYYYLKPLRPPVAENLDYHATLGALAQKNGDYHTAHQVYSQLVQAQPEKAQWWLGLAITQERLGQLNQAKSSYQQANQMGQLSNSSRLYIEQRLQKLTSIKPTR